MNHSKRVHRALSDESGLWALREIRRGIEKENLRMTPEGALARTGHPRSLGSALTHPHITTDFAEPQIEFISGVHHSLDECLNEMLDLHAFTYSQLERERELLWTSSMPCLIGGEEDIPLANYGDTNEGQLKHLYRTSLALRYGAKMQTVSGIHYNLSLPSEPLAELFGSQTAAYMHMIRNVNRYTWLLILLFGASPALCHTFLPDGVTPKLKHWDAGTLYRRYATSLRMGPLGYTGKSQRNLYVSCNSLEDYIQGLVRAMKTPYAPFSSLGLYANGQRQQMSQNLLQFEAEYYGSIRPKRVHKTGERAVEALVRAGVEYVELRCIDLNPYDPIGISAEQARFYDSFLLACLVMDSRPDSRDEARENRRNLWRVVRSGRSPRLKLKSQGEARKGRAWARELLESCEMAAELLDSANASKDYTAAVKAQLEKIKDPELTPSARILRELERSRQSFFSYSKDLAIANQALLLMRELSAERRDLLEAEVSRSLEEADQLERQPQSDFDEFVDAWLARV